MNRNQKIALGCGIAGCLGLILIVIATVVLGVLGYVAIPGTSNRNDDFNSNLNSNYNSNDNANTNSDSNSNSSSTSSSMSDDEKHKLFQAVGMTKDQALMQRALRKMGFITNTGISGDYEQFVKEHISWALRNVEFVQSVSTESAARAYVEQHMDD